MRARIFGAEKSTGPAAEEAGGILTIDLNALAANYRDLKKRAAPAACAAVVKADGYGLGLGPVAQALAGAGCTTFFVALIEEALRLRAALPTAAIYVLDGLNPGTAALFRTLRVEPVLGSWPEIDEWDGLAADSDEPLPAAVHIDTGMRRHGISNEDAIAFAERLKLLHFKPSLVMSHLACADDPSHPMNAQQIVEFRALRSFFPGIPASLANSAGLLAHPDARFDLVRPGISLYGGRALIKGDNPMRPVVRLQLRIVQVRNVNKGESVGYSAEQHLARDSRIAVLAAGYADGIFRAAGASDNKKGAEAVVAGKRCPIVGRVSMDLITIDVTNVPEAEVKRGDLATLIGDGISVDDFAARAGTIGYEVLTNLGRRFARVYVGG
ncbi:MAG: alanine racemase [Xanthobacteraceae bacterium]|nr:alanine racemase [Xanthobacteraceae bacterium]